MKFYPSQPHPKHQIHHTFLRFLATFVLLCSCCGQSITFLYDLIYRDLIPIPIYRMLNSSGMTGATGQPSTGVLYDVKAQSDLDDFNKNTPNNKYVVLLPFELLSRTNINTLARTDKVGGLLVLEGDRRSSSSLAKISSHDSDCPNCEFGLYASNPDRNKWNPNVW